MPLLHQKDLTQLLQLQAEQLGLYVIGVEKPEDAALLGEQCNEHGNVVRVVRKPDPP